MIAHLTTKWFHSLFIVAALTTATTAYRVQAENVASKKESTRFPEVHEQLDMLVKQNEISGAVTAVVTPDRLLHLDAVGLADIEKQIPMQPNTIFWIASMTKPVAGLAICKLEEEGKLKLDDPVSKYIPEFKELKNAEGESVEVTILQLLTHTSGLQEVDRGRTHHFTTLKEFIPHYVQKPVHFQPGTQWKYSQTGINTAGHIVEVLTGVSFDEYVKREFFEPLKMVDTTFYLNDEQATRLATAYRRTDDGELIVEPVHYLLRYGKLAQRRDRAPYPNAGLFTTAPDYARLAQMLLNEGEVDGRRYLKPETVKRFRTMYTAPELTTGFTPGNSWGVGTCVVREPQGITAKLSPGTFGHGGAYGTQIWIDPVKKKAWVLMVQRSNFKNGDASVARQAFQDAFLSK